MSFQVSIERERHRSAYPLNADGQRYCTECGYVLTPENWGCIPCDQKQTAERDRRERVRQAEDSWTRCLEGVGGAFDLGGNLPRWPWADFGNGAWRKRCDQRVLSAIESWTLDAGRLCILAPTGSGKSSAIVARLRRQRAEIMAAAEQGDGWRNHSWWFVYTTGYELAEATKRRRLGEMAHELVDEAGTRQLLILDELNRSVPADIAGAIIDRRDGRGRVTITLSGMTELELVSHFGAAFLRKSCQGGRYLDLHPKKESGCG